MGRLSQKIGSDGAAVLRNRLLAAGWLHVIEVQTPMIKTPKGWKFSAKARNDVLAAHPITGQMLLAECKSYKGKLPFSEVKPHQRRFLNEHAEGPGLAMLAWLDTLTYTSYFIPWPIEGFEPGTSLKTEQAERLAIVKAKDWPTM